VKINRLVGPCTHICWTPNGKPRDEMDSVSLVLESDLKAAEDEIERLRGLAVVADIQRDLDRKGLVIVSESELSTLERQAGVK